MINMFRLYTKMKLLPFLAAVFLLFLVAGCNQDSIFDDISWETAPTQPKIKGSPSKIVEASVDGRKLYVANGRLWECDPSNPAAARWNQASGPEGYVVDVTSVTDGSAGILYVLTINNTSTRVWKKDGAGWTAVARLGDYDFIQNIFGAGDTLFAAGAKRAGDDYNYAILYYQQPDPADQDPGFRFLTETGKSLLSGAGKVGADYYLATLGSGIYKVPDSGALTATAVTRDPPLPANIAGFLQAEDDAIIGISKGGYILYIDPTGIKDPGASLGGTYTGALALLDSPDPQPDPQGGFFDKLLLLGYRGANSSYRHGYLEVQFNLVNGDHEGNSRVPGADPNQPSSIKKDPERKDQQYTSSLRRYPVTALWVLPSADPAKTPSVLFAATTNQGVYSYRDRSDGGWQWNHEE
jgi:hypothetical protein